MPAAYTHLTLVNEVAKDSRLPLALMDAAGRWMRFVELGAVSPDLAYLVIGPGSRDATAWADRMHTHDAGRMIHAGAALLPRQPEESRERCLAWLMGYSAHVVADVVIHPVVNAIVGEPYIDHKKDHRICEMHQDVHIWARMNLGEIGLAEHLDSGVGRCGDETGIDPVIRGFWEDMLRTAYGNWEAGAGPDIDMWYLRFLVAVDKIAEEGNRLMPLARHVAAGVAGLVYPEAADRRFIENVNTPAGPRHYDEVFDHAKEACVEVWLDLIGAAPAERRFARVDPSWNLDSGRTPTGNYTLWS